MQVVRGQKPSKDEMPLSQIKSLPNSYIGDSKKNDANSGDYFSFDYFKQNMADFEMVSNLG